MLGINKLIITPDVMKRACAVDEFRGYWHGLAEHTTALNLLREVRGHGVAWGSMLTSLQEKPVTPEVIALLHALSQGEKKPSAYKTEENQLIVNNVEGVPVGFLDTAMPSEVEPLMAKLCEWINSALEADDLHPLIVIAVFAAVFLQISPYPEGNQKALSLVLTILMAKAGYEYAPFVPLEPDIRGAAGLWYRALKHNQRALEDGRPDWQNWLVCFLDILGANAERMRERINAKDRDLSDLPTLSARILALFEEYERLQMKEIIKLTNGRRATIKLRLKELLEAGYLTRSGQARSTFYSLSK